MNTALLPDVNVCECAIRHNQTNDIASALQLQAVLCVIRTEVYSICVNHVLLKFAVGYKLLQ